MVHKDVLDKAANKVVELNMKAIDIYEREFIKPLIDEIKNPEKIIGKKYQEWTPQDLQMLTQVYQATPQILNDFIASKEYDSLVALQMEV